MNWHWSYLNEKEISLICDRCGASITPKLLMGESAFIRDCEQFKKTHRNCQEKRVEK
jgi:hypothetical protein